MKFPTSRILCTLTGLAAVLCAPPTIADDSEVFTSSAFTTGVGARPNVLFIMDTSGSMDGEVIIYDPLKTYTGSVRRGLRVLGHGQQFRHTAGLHHDHAQVHAGQQPLPRLLRGHAGKRLVERPRAAAQYRQSDILGRSRRRR